MRIDLAATGASGTINLQRLHDHLAGDAHELHLILSPYARQFVRLRRYSAQRIRGGRLKDGWKRIRYRWIFFVNIGIKAAHGLV